MHKFYPFEIGEKTEGSEFLHEVLEAMVYAFAVVFAEEFVDSLLFSLHAMVYIDCVVVDVFEGTRVHPSFDC